jgi:methyl-accepting chemotaxis protein
MPRALTHGKKVGAGFAVIAALAVFTAILAVFALRSVSARKDQVLDVEARSLVVIEQARAGVLRKIAALRGYLLDGNEDHGVEMRDGRERFLAAVDKARNLSPESNVRRELQEIADLEAAHEVQTGRAIVMKRSAAAQDEVSRMFEENLRPLAMDLERKMDAFLDGREIELQSAMKAASEQVSSTIVRVAGVAALTAVLALAVAMLITRSTTRQIGEAVGQVQSSSAELQATANQQATGAKEQATAMNEITTTISELLATSQQIAASAQRVAAIADDTAHSARAGEDTVAKTQESLGMIRRQVDLVVNHMIDLGGKSQQIGAVLDIVSELAEQTNILAINATIEAAGAGETGKRFAVVADEIRKLADRVGGSTKEIRLLIDDVRGAVNTTVMATESGSKAVDAGSRQFVDVAEALKRIAVQIATTNEAAREIELSTKQQTSAVAQVKVAISNVAQATREAEASSGQTLQTASQLATLSRSLRRFIQPRVAA